MFIPILPSPMNPSSIRELLGLSPVTADAASVDRSTGRCGSSHVARETRSVRGGNRLTALLRSVDASRIRDILKEEIGKLPAKVEPIGEGGGRQELSGQVGERRLARKHEPMNIHRGDQPKPSQTKECRDDNPRKTASIGNGPFPVCPRDPVFFPAGDNTPPSSESVR